MTELSFWEKIGFTNKSKRVMMLVKGREKIDESYQWLRSTMIQSKQLSNLLADKKQHIADLHSEQEMLVAQITEAQQELIKHDGLVEEARSELKQTESRKNQEIEDKNNEIQECQIKLSLQKNEMNRLHETAQFMFEDERSKCLKLAGKMAMEM